MSAHPDRSTAVRRCTLLAAALAAIGASLAALPHPHDLAATAANEPAAVEDVPTITVTGERTHIAEHIRIDPVAARRGDLPGAQALASIEEFVSRVRQAFGSQAASDATSPVSAATTKLRSENVHRALASEYGRDTGSGSRLAAPASQPQAPDSRKALPSISEHTGSPTASASSTYGPHAVSGVLDYIVNRHSQGISIASSYGFYSQNARPARSPRKPRQSETFADRVSTTLQMFSVTPGQRPDT